MKPLSVSIDSDKMMKKGSPISILTRRNYHNGNKMEDFLHYPLED